ncbi:FeoB-associated Cys-rich membrane protein [Flavobacterium branchiophilum]|uniref:FeoB-associated Cys-rich membrane protein n=1 Tax=Flavobacterium branchiophilum TaxID=55197 RepID=A0A2H3KBP0_9FLAO|nr:FeoB-associated Cys-rich membrane protein [Flavobacterium branchiophilum]PDS24496.1 FeoB-associated Cys-rich membrane protein [Flavobacterium branchiophilum]
MIQDILSFATLGLALYALFYKFFPKKKKNNKSCGDDCQCH